jgi:hypothetical protein
MISLQEFSKWVTRMHLKKSRNLNLDETRDASNAFGDESMRSGYSVGEVSFSSSADEPHISAYRRHCSRLASTRNIGICRVARTIVESQALIWAVLGLILINTVLLSAEYHDDSLCDALEDIVTGRQTGVCMNESFRDFLNIANVVLTILFGLEMALKLVGLGIVEYLDDKMNRFDGCIVIVSVVELIFQTISQSSEEGGILTLLRAGRLLRVRPHFPVLDGANIGGYGPQQLTTVYGCCCRSSDQREHGLRLPKLSGS